MRCTRFGCSSAYLLHAAGTADVTHQTARPDEPGSSLAATLDSAGLTYDPPGGRRGKEWRMPDFLHRTYDIHQLELASALDEVSFWSSRFGALLFKHLPLRPALRILDLGCGTGFPTLELAQVYGTSCVVTGIDIWQEAILRAQVKQRAYQITNANLLLADAAHLPFLDQEYDLI